MPRPPSQGRGLTLPHPPWGGWGSPRPEDGFGQGRSLASPILSGNLPQQKRGSFRAGKWEVFPRSMQIPQEPVQRSTSFTELPSEIHTKCFVPGGFLSPRKTEGHQLGLTKPTLPPPPILGLCRAGLDKASPGSKEGPSFLLLLDRQGAAVPDWGEARLTPQPALLHPERLLLEFLLSWPVPVFVCGPCVYPPTDSEVLGKRGPRGMRGAGTQGDTEWSFLRCLYLRNLKGMSQTQYILGTTKACNWNSAFRKLCLKINGTVSSQSSAP